MKEQLLEIKVDTYLHEGDKDLLFPHKQSFGNTKKYITTLKGVEVFPNVGHGIETYAKALNYMGTKIK